MFEGVNLFDGLTNDQKESLALFCQERVLRADDFLFHEGDDPIAMYILRSGRFRAVRIRSEWDVFVGFIEPGEMIGEMALFEPGYPKKRMASIQAVQDSTVVIIMEYAIREISSKHPEIYQMIQSVIEERKKRSQELGIQA